MDERDKGIAGMKTTRINIAWNDQRQAMMDLLEVNGNASLTIHSLMLFALANRAKWGQFKRKCDGLGAVREQTIEALDRE